jgi:peptide/nickel transport system substrate-binding protein
MKSNQSKKPLNWKLGRREFFRYAGIAGLAGPTIAATGNLFNASAQAAARGGTLVFGSELADFPSLDENAANAAGYAGLRTVQHIFEGLLDWDFYSKPDQQPPPAPALATSWKGSEDRLTWTFQLRRGVKFHDGTDFNADAVIFNFERIWNHSFPNYDKLVGTFVNIWTQKVKDFRKLGDYEVEVRLSAPRPLDEQIQYALIASPTAVKKYGSEFGMHPTGTGPFKFEQVVPGQKLEYSAFENYRNAGYPRIARLIYRPIPDASARTASLLAGETNFIAPVQPDDIARLKAAGLRISQAAYPQYWTFWFNTHSGPFTNKLVRQAANYAADKESLVKNLLKGTAVPEYQPVAPFSPFYNKKLGEVYKYDPGKAKQLLAAAGHSEGIDVLVHVPTSGSGMMYPIPMAEFIQSNLRQVGIRVKFQTWEWASFVENVLVTQKKPKWDAFVLGHAHMDQSWYWTNYNTEAWAPNSWNMNLYSNSHVDKLSDQILRVSDPNKIREIAYKLDELIVEDAPNLYVAHDTNPKAYAPTVEGFVDSHSWAFTKPFARVQVQEKK